MSRGRYFLGRVIKLNLTQQQLMDAIANPPIISRGKFDWTFTDVEDRRDETFPYVFGKMSKYAKDGQAKVIDEVNRSQIDTEVPNLLVASSPFVYLPECSGLAFLHVWNGIQEDTFPKRFKSIIEKAFDNLFVHCEVEPVSDYQEFSSRLKKLDKFTEFSAKVFPPNPLFGRLWAGLNEYIKDRNASEVAIKEQGFRAEGLNTNIVELMEKMVRSPNYEPAYIPAIGDAAILMAADGYGKGKVVGIEDGEEMVVKTSDARKSFLYDMDASPTDLALRAKMHFDRVSEERDMQH